MATIRKLVFQNESYYHVYNRGIDRRVTFSNKREYKRAKELLHFYQYAEVPQRFSRFTSAPLDMQEMYMDKMIVSGRMVEIVAYCLMPNHFHLLLKQKQEKGIPTFVSNFINAYTKYFNTKHKRTGPLFQGVFKAVYVETDEQLMHLTRYIHLNPVAASLIARDDLPTYPWSSYSSYLTNTERDTIISKQEVQQIQAMVPDYASFVNNQIDYAKQLEALKHVMLE